jgi:hypothetical protein
MQSKKRKTVFQAIEAKMDELSNAKQKLDGVGEGNGDGSSDSNPDGLEENNGDGSIKFNPDELIR